MLSVIEFTEEEKETLSEWASYANDFRHRNANDDLFELAYKIKCNKMVLVAPTELEITILQRYLKF